MTPTQGQNASAAALSTRGGNRGEIFNTACQHASLPRYSALLRANALLNVKKQRDANPPSRGLENYSQTTKGEILYKSTLQSYRLDFCVSFQTAYAEFASMPGHLVPTERCHRGEDVVTVDPEQYNSINEVTQHKRNSV